MASKGAGTLGLVHDLSIKLTKQRKQLNELIKEVNQQKASQMKRWHYVAIAFMNSIVVTALGFAAGSALYGVAPEGGSFAASKMALAGLEVSQAPAQNVLVESKGGESSVSVGSAGTTELQMGQRSSPMSLTAPDKRTLSVTRGGVAHLRIGRRESNPNVTDVHFYPSKHVLVDNNLRLDGKSIVAVNGSLMLRPGNEKNVELAPSGGGAVFFGSSTVVGGAIKVGDPNLGVYTMYARILITSPNEIAQIAGTTAQKVERQLKVGDAMQSADLFVNGRTTISDRLTIQGNLKLSKGNMFLGQAKIETAGSLSVGGDTVFAKSANSTVQVKATLYVGNSSLPVAAATPTNGRLSSSGSLNVGGTVVLRGKVALGSQARHSVSIASKLSEMKNLTADGDVQLGDADSDNVDVFGELQLRNTNPRTGKQDVHFSVQQSSGDVYVGSTFTVSKTVQISGNTSIGSPAGSKTTSVNGTNTTAPTDATTFRVNSEATFSAPVSMAAPGGGLALAVQGTSRLEMLTGHNLTCDSDLVMHRGYNTLFTVGHQSGDISAGGSLDVARAAEIKHSVTVTGTVKSNGDILMRAPLVVSKDMSGHGNLEVDGDVSLGGSVRTVSEAVFNSNMYLGTSSKQVHEIRGSLKVTDVSRSAVNATRFMVDAATGNTGVEGQLTVMGQTSMANVAIVDGTIVVNGQAQFSAELNAQKDVTTADYVEVRKGATVSGNMKAKRNLVTPGDVLLGSQCPDPAPGSLTCNRIQFDGRLHVVAQSGDSIMSVRENVNVHDGVTLRVNGATHFQSTTDMGRQTSAGTTKDEIQMLAKTVLAAEAATQDIIMNGKLDVSGNATARVRVTARHDVVLGNNALHDATTIAGSLSVSDGKANAVLSVNYGSGLVRIGTKLSTVNVNVQQNLSLAAGAKLFSTEFSAIDILADTIDERLDAGGKPTGKGVLIENVLFRDGAVETSRIHEMLEKVPTKGVTIESVTMKKGSMILTSKEPGVNPKVNWDMLTLENLNHAEAMANSSTSLSFRQYFHDSAGVHAPRDSATISIHLEQNWGDKKDSYASYLAFKTTNSGTLKERARLSSAGTFSLNTDKITMSPLMGETRIQGDVDIGAVAGNRSVTVVSKQGASKLILSSGKGVDGAEKPVNFDASVVLSTTGQQDFSIVQDVSTGSEALLQIIDATSKLVTLGQAGDLWVSGDIIIGEHDLADKQSLLVQAKGATTLSASAGASGEGSLIITSGKDKNAKLLLTDPADGKRGSSFEIYNDGSMNSNGTLRFTDGTNNLMIVTAQGTVGSLMVGGDLFLKADGSIPRKLQVLSKQQASISIRSDNKDSEMRLTSGNNSNAKFTFSDPTGTSDFELVNSGTSSSMSSIAGSLAPPRLDWSYAGKTMISLHDTGKRADLAVTGNGICGTLEGAGTRTFKVQSDAQAEINLVSGPSKNAVLNITSGFDKNSMLELAVLVTKAGDTAKTHTFQLSNVGSSSTAITAANGAEVASGTPTLRMTSDSKTELLKLVDTGTKAKLFVSGDAHFAGTVGNRVLNIASADQASTLSVISGVSNDSVVAISSKPNGRASLKLVDPNTGSSGTFEMYNEGATNAVPELTIADKSGNRLMRVLDQGMSGDLQVTGDGIFGDASNMLESRSLRVIANRNSTLSVTSGAASNALLGLQCGAAAETQILFNSSAGIAYTILQNGSANSFDVVRGNSSMLRITDKGLVGDLVISGDTLIGGNSIAARRLTVASSDVAKLSITSGIRDEAIVNVMAGPNQDATLRLTAGSGGAKSQFEVQNDGSNSPLPMLAFTNGADQLLTITDQGSTGDLTASGDGVFGFVDVEAATNSTTSVSIISRLSSTLDLLAGAASAATATLESGPDKNSQVILSQNVSAFEITHQGAATKPTLSIADTLHANITVLSLTDAGPVGSLEFSGNLELTTAGIANEKVNLLVTSGAASAVAIRSGSGEAGIITLLAGTDQATTLRLFNPFVPAYQGAPVTGTAFEFTSMGSVLGDKSKKELRITDSANTILSFVDTGLTADLIVPSSISCVNAQTDGKTHLGASKSSDITINGHITSPEFLFDANSNGLYTKLKFMDPSKKTTIVFPDESGTVLTSSSPYSEIRSVGGLAKGSIVNGFGTITTSQSITTTGPMQAAGDFTAAASVIAQGDVTLGDATSDQVFFRGMSTSNFGFGNGIGMKFVSADSTKSTVFKAAFDATSGTSPAGVRSINIPDIPTGGMLHVVYKDSNVVEYTATNVHAVSVDAISGVIRSHVSDLAAGDSNTLMVNNKRIKTTSTVIATMSDDGQGGWVIVTAVKVNSQDGGCSVVVQNVHPTQKMISNFAVSFVVFNAA